MRLLFDQNLSRRLVSELAPWFPESGHVAALGIEAATDREIWAYAGEHGYLIVSKDSDFRQLAVPARATAEGGLAQRRQLRNLGDRRPFAHQRRRHRRLHRLGGRSTAGAPQP